MKIVVTTTEYADGTIIEYKRAVETKEEIAYREQLIRDNPEAEKKRVSSVKTKSNAKNRALSFPFTHFITYTTSDLTLANDGRKLLKAVKADLERQNCNYHIQLEAFDNEEKGFHVHGMTDREIDFTEWEQNYGYIDDNPESIMDENWKNLGNFRFSNFKNLYCGEIYSERKNCIDYINKKVGLTKDRVPTGTHVYLSNVKRLPKIKNTSIIDTDDNSTITVFENNIAEYISNKEVFLQDKTFDLPINELKSELFYVLCKLYTLKKSKQIYKLQNKQIPQRFRDLESVINNDISKIEHKYNEILETPCDFNIFKRNLNQIVIMNHGELDVKSIDMCDYYSANDDLIPRGGVHNFVQRLSNNEKNVLKVEAMLYHNIHTSNTGHHEYPILQKNVVKIEKYNRTCRINKYLMRYVSYVSHIPDT